jgi:putative pyoverdin transport system ATP-binding/permease protein
MAVLRLLFRCARGLVILAVITGALGGASAAVLVGFLRYALGTESRGWVLPFLGACLLQFALNVASYSILLRVIHGTILPTFRKDMVRDILSAGLRRLEETGDGVLVGAVTWSAAQIGFAATAWILVMRSTAGIVACLLYVALHTPRLALMALAAVGIGLLAVVALFNSAHRRLTAARTSQDRVLSHLRGVVSGTKELKMNLARRNAFLSDALLLDVNAMHRELAAGNLLNAAAAAWASILVLSAVGVALLLVRSSPHGSADLAAFAMAMVYVQAELGTLLNAFGTVREGEIALRSAASLPIHEGVDGATVPSTVPASASRLLELRGVTHSYRRPDQGATFTLGPVQLQLRPSEIVFLVGGNGSGKSTLAKLILGLYAPDSGAIFIGGSPILPAQQRERSSAILSNWFVFNRLYGLEADDIDDRANTALEALKMGHKVSVKDATFSTTALSQGQRKRLALLTACLENRDLFVLDEWASDQDPAFKEHYYTQILPGLKARGKTCIVVTHDDSFFHMADRIVQLEDGSIVYDGPPVGVHPPRPREPASESNA